MKKAGFCFLISLAVLCTSVAFIGCAGDSSGGGGDTPLSLSDGKSITAFSFTSPAATGMINESAMTITVIIPYGTDVTALVAAFTTTGANVKIGSATQVSGTTANDFTNPVSYTVTAADGSTATYTVTVTVASSSAKAIAIFWFTSPEATGTINESAKTISVTVPYGTNVTALAATFMTTGVNVKIGSTTQVSGTTPNDFTNPVSYVVTAADGSTATYTVTVTVAPSSAKAITAFSFANPAATGTVDENVKTIAVTVPYGTDITMLVATFTTTGANVKIGSTTQVSGTTPNDFTNPISYVVTAADGSTAAYTVTVTIARTQWAQTVTAGNGNSVFHGVSVASDGSVYAAGEITGTGIFDFGNGVTTTGTYSNSNIVLVKYDSTGVAQWAKTVTAGGSASAFFSVSAASDGSGSVYAAGYIIGTNPYDFGNGVFATGAYLNGNIVLVKYGSDGVAQWAKTVTTGNSYSFFYSVSVASDGSVYAAGYIDGTDTYDFGNSVTAAGTYSVDNIVLVKYDKDGVAQWAQTVTAGSSNSVFYGISVASDGSVYAAGYIDGTGTYDFGNSVTTAGTYSVDNIVLVKYDSTGAAQWAQTVTTGSSNSVFYGVSVASDGSVYAAGYIDGTGNYSFGNSVTAAGTFGNDNIALVKYDSTGVAQWAQTVTAGNSNSVFYGVSVASDGSVYAGGYIDGTGTYDFGNSVTAAGTFGNDNIALVKYDSTGVAQWAQTVTAGNSNSVFYNISAAPDGSVCAAGKIIGTGIYDFGNSVTAAGTFSTNIVLVKYY